MRILTAWRAAAVLLAAVVIAGCPGTTHTVKVGYLYEPEENRDQPPDGLRRHRGRLARRAGAGQRGRLRAVHLRAHREGERDDAPAQPAGVVLPDAGAVMVGGGQ